MFRSELTSDTAIAEAELAQAMPPILVAETPFSPDRAAALDALRRVLSSSEFQTSQQLSAFLTFSVGRTLEGRGASLKAYTVATEVFRRGQDFDPQIDPIVRVEATRLRRALERFYGGVGADAPLRIVLPRGTYAVSFETPAKSETRIDAECVGGSDREGSGLRSISFGRLRLDERSPVMWSSIGAVVFGLSLWLASPVQTQRSDTAFLAASPVLASLEPAASTAVAVVTGEDVQLGLLAEDLRDALAAMRHFEVSAQADARRAETADGLLVAVRRVPAAEGDRIVVRLVGARDGVILWSSSFGTESLLERREAAVRAIADAIALHENAKRARQRAARPEAARSPG